MRALVTCATYAVLLAMSGCANSGATRSGGTSAVSTTVAAAPRPARGPAVLSIVLDQLSAQTLAKLEPLLEAEGAIARARKQGRVYRRVAFPYAATLTAPGFAAIYTGAPPAQSGITGNARLDRATGLSLALVDDRASAVLGVADAYGAPTLLRVPTVADALKAATAGQAKVVSLAAKDRAAILPGGQRPDLVLWYEPEIPGFTTSQYYARELPAWVQAHNAQYPPSLAARWDVEHPERLLALLGPDDGKGEGPPSGMSAVFPHELARSARPAHDWPLFPASTDALLLLAASAVEQVGLCRDEVPDLLALSVSATDLVGHRFGPDSWEYAETLRYADLALGRFIAQLEQRCELQVLITSDHGVTPLPEQSGGVRVGGVVQAVEAALDRALGEGEWALRYDPPYLWLGETGRAYTDRRAFQDALAAALSAIPGIAEGIDVRDRERLVARDDEVAQLVLASVDPERSGEIFIVLEPLAVPAFAASGTGTTHGSHHACDREVPVLLFGPGIAPATHIEPLSQLRVASTLAAMLKIEPPLPDAPPPLPGVTPLSRTAGPGAER